MDERVKNKFCSKPFEFLELGRTHNGETESFACCPAWLPVNLGDLGTQGVTEIWNSKLIQKVRESVHDGSFRYCKKDLCPFISTDTLPSKDGIKDEYLRDIIEKKITRLTKGPRELNFSNDRSCNLTCPSCRSEKIMLSSGDNYQYMLQMHENLIKDTLKDVTLMIFSSTGDPFASKLHRKFLLELNGADYPDLKIQINTNGLLFTEAMWNKMFKIHKNIYRIYISVDAASSNVYQAVRRGGRLSDLLPNIEFLSSLRKKNMFEHFQLDFVVQDQNYKDMNDFVILGKKYGVDKVYFQKIINWGTFSDDEFEKQAVYLKSHPNNEDFRNKLKNPIFKEDIVNMGNCFEYLSD